MSHNNRTVLTKSGPPIFDFILRMNLELENSVDNDFTSIIYNHFLVNSDDRKLNSVRIRQGEVEYRKIISRTERKSCPVNSLREIDVDIVTPDKNEHAMSLNHNSSWFRKSSRSSRNRGDSSSDDTHSNSDDGTTSSKIEFFASGSCCQSSNNNIDEGKLEQRTPPSSSYLSDFLRSIPFMKRIHRFFDLQPQNRN